MTRCARCEGTRKGDGGRCQRKASCHVNDSEGQGCVKRCWQHAYIHVKGCVCKDVRHARHFERQQNGCCFVHAVNHTIGRRLLVCEDVIDWLNATPPHNHEHHTVDSGIPVNGMDDYLFQHYGLSLEDAPEIDEAWKLEIQHARHENTFDALYSGRLLLSTFHEYYPNIHRWIVIYVRMWNGRRVAHAVHWRVAQSYCVWELDSNHVRKGGVHVDPIDLGIKCTNWIKVSFHFIPSHTK